MGTVEQANLSYKVLLLDPNNYRFQDTNDFVYASLDRFDEETVQSRAYQRLQKEGGIQELKQSIVHNGYLPVERLVVAPYKKLRSGHYVVIEGNRRLAAVRWIVSDYQAGVDITKDVLESFEAIPCIIVDEDDDVFRSSLMGVRHVSGTKQWGGYQRAKLIVHMRDELGLEASEIAERLALSSREVARRYRAFKALQQMQNDDEYGEFAKPSMYPVFHEAVSLPIVRDDWLGWAESDNEFTSDSNLATFYNLISPRRDEEGVELPPKVSSYYQVRDMKSILDSPEALRVLVDPDRSFDDSLSLARVDDVLREWKHEIEEAISALRRIPTQDLKDLDEAGVALLQQLNDVVAERISDYRKLAQ